MSGKPTLLVHICCGPCAITVLEWLLDRGYAPTGLFFNPNIHPLAEYLRRREGAIAVARHFGIPLLCADTLPVDQQKYPSEAFTTLLPSGPFPTDPAQAASIASCPPVSRPSGEAALYPNDRGLDGLPPAVDPVRWMRFMHGREYARCTLCWSLRLHKAAQLAAEKGFSAFTSTLLYSRYQRHDLLREQGEALALAQGLEFVYHDFRQFWQRGIDRSKEMGLYRQQYCGCLYSEYARYKKQCLRIIEHFQSDNALTDDGASLVRANEE